VSRPCYECFGISFLDHAVSGEAGTDRSFACRVTFRCAPVVNGGPQLNTPDVSSSALRRLAWAHATELAILQRRCPDGGGFMRARQGVSAARSRAGQPVFRNRITSCVSTWYKCALNLFCGPDRHFDDVADIDGPRGFAARTSGPVRQVFGILVDAAFANSNVGASSVYGASSDP
jgi:hypothetical protein